MDKQRSQAIESLQIFGNHVECQRCGNAVPIVGKLTNTGNDRIAVLQKRIRWMENYSHISNINNLKALKQELADLLEEDAKADKLRSLPLFVDEGAKFII